MPVIARGSFEMLVPEDPQVFAYRRELDGAALTVVANLSGATASVPGLERPGSVLLVSNLKQASPGEELRPWEVRVTRLG